MANCKSCGAEIEWVESSRRNFPMPLDVTRDSRGNQIETPNGNLAVVGKVARPYSEQDKKLARDRRMSHFATCPNAGQWRRDR